MEDSSAQPLIAADWIWLSRGRSVGPVGLVNGSFSLSFFIASKDILSAPEMFPLEGTAHARIRYRIVQPRQAGNRDRIPEPIH